MSCQISSSGWKLVPVEPTEEMLNALFDNHSVLPDDGDLIVQYRAMLAAAPDSPSAEPVAWMSPGKERLEFSRPDTVYGSHTIPLYAIPPDAAAEIARLRAEVEQKDAQIKVLDDLILGYAEEQKRLDSDVERLMNERDIEIARNKPLHSLIKSLEETKSLLLRKKDERREAVNTLESERASNEQLTNTIAEQAEEIQRLQREVVNRNQRALDGDMAVAVNEKLIDEIEQQAERIESLQALASQINTDWIPANERLCQRIAELESLLDVEKGQFAIRDEACGVLFARVDAQAAALAKAREALKVAVDTDQLQGGLWEERAIEAIDAIDALKGNE